MKNPIMEEIRKRLWGIADDLGWSNLSDAERAKYYEQWTRDPSIGGQIAHLRDSRQVRVYIKDSLLKPYERSRVLLNGTAACSLLGVLDGVKLAREYIKPHGRQLEDGRVICWGKSRDWKSVVMAAFERGNASREVSPFGVVLLETGGTATRSRRALVTDAATRLGIEKIAWLE